MSNAAKKELHDLVEDLPDSQIPEVRRYLRYMRGVSMDPVLRAALDAPLDDEEETPEEAAAVQEAREAVARGEVLSDEELRRELGL